MIIGDALVTAHPLQLGQHFLELADEQHVAVDAASILSGEATVGQLICQRLAIDVDRDCPQVDGFGLPDFLGRDDEAFDHAHSTPTTRAMRITGGGVRGRNPWG